MVRLAMISSRKLIKILEKLGFEELRQNGSHRIFFNRETGKVATIPFHGGEDIGRGLLRKILKDIKLSLDEFEKLR